MKNKLTNMLNRLFLILLVFVFYLSGCGNTNNTYGKAWVVDQNNYFHTNNLDRAQQQIPFTIIIPKYLPTLLGADYAFQIDGPLKSSDLQRVEVEISYAKEKHLIFISEQNIRLVMEPNVGDLEAIYYDVSGIKVLRQTAKMASATGITEGLRFDWNQNGLTFTVRIFSISEDEGIKIVESMVEQIQSYN